MSKQEYID